MKDYATMTPEAKTAYNEGLIDAINRLRSKEKAESSELIACGLRIAANELAVFRNEQINAAPQQ